MSGDGHEMMDCVNLDHGEEPHVLELARELQSLHSSGTLPRLGS